MQFEGVLPEIALGVAYALVDFDGKVGVVVDDPSEAYEITDMCAHLAGYPSAEHVDGIGQPLVRRHIMSVLDTETLEPTAAHTA